MTPLSEKAKEIMCSDSRNYEDQLAFEDGFEIGYDVRDCELQAELTRLKKEVEQLRGRLPDTRIKAEDVKCLHPIVTREFPSQPYGTCAFCGQTVFN